MTTLSPAYYETVEGSRILALIEKYRPEMYLEVHCYRLSAYDALTNPARRAAKGVPPLVELEEGVLLGSVSPLLALRFTFDLSLLLEIPCRGQAGRSVALDVLKTVRDAAKPEEALRWLRGRYGERLVKPLELLRDCSGDSRRGMQ